jgi:uncharacterized membrane protein
VSKDAVVQGALPRARMAIAVLSLIGLIVAGYLSLHRMGFIGELQCSIGGCEVVQSSRYAVFLGMPVAYLGLVAYVGLLVVSLIGVQPGRERDRRISIALLAGSAVGVLFSAYLTYLEAFVIHAWCQWCVISAVIVTCIFVISVIEVWE